MRIAVEIGWAHKEGGARRAAVQTLKEMAHLFPDNEYLIYANSPQERLRDTPIQQEVLKPPKWIHQVVWDQFIFPHLAVPRAAARFKPDLIYHTNNLVSFWGKIPVVVSIYDMLPFVMPESFIYWHALYQRAYFRHAARKAKKIITISKNSKEDICRILKVKENKVHVIPLASNLSLEQHPLGSNKKRFVTDPYILYAGAVHPRKNVARLIRVFGRLIQAKGIPHVLVIAGSFRWKGKEVKEAAENLYRNCAVFVYPSLYEGFGLPVLEAMSFGAPVVTSNVSSLPEVAGDAALLVDPENEDDLFSAIWEILDKPGLAEGLRQKALNRAGLFSWERTAREVFNVFKLALGE
jgi:glycosyltransferase involved in cell wall biosynthesis